MKKIISITLCIIMLLCVFTSCQRVETTPGAVTPPTEDKTAPVTQELTKPKTQAVTAEQTAPNTEQALLEEKYGFSYEEAKKLLIEGNGLSHFKTEEKTVFSVSKRAVDSMRMAMELNTEKSWNLAISFCDIILSLAEEKNCLDNFSLSNQSGGKLIYTDGAFILDDTLIYFKDHGTIKSFTIPVDVKKIAKRAFANNSVLEEVNFPEYNDRPVQNGKMITEIGESAFVNCPSLKKINTRRSIATPRFPDMWHQWESIGYDNVIFTYDYYLSGIKNDSNAMIKDYNSSVKTLPVDDDPNNYIVKDGVLLKYLGIGGHIVIPEGVTEIRGGVFDHCKNNVLKVSLPSTLKKICTWAFIRMPFLIQLDMPAGLELIEYQAIQNDAGISHIIITGLPENCEIQDENYRLVCLDGGVEKEIKLYNN